MGGGYELAAEGSPTRVIMVGGLMMLLVDACGKSGGFCCDVKLLVGDGQEVI